jgi:hypothetical protein
LGKNRFERTSDGPSIERFDTQVSGRIGLDEEPMGVFYTDIHYVSSGIPGHMEGKFYCESPDELRRIFAHVDSRPAPQKYCVVKPLSLFEKDEQPQLTNADLKDIDAFI